MSIESSSVPSDASEAGDHELPALRPSGAIEGREARPVTVSMGKPSVLILASGPNANGIPDGEEQGRLARWAYNPGMERPVDAVTAAVLKLQSAQRAVNALIQELIARVSADPLAQSA